MSGLPDTLLFRFSAHADSILCKMNALREERRFCDVTLLIGSPSGLVSGPLHFHGHRVVLAASSDFLRDQFLLHGERAELSLGLVSRVEVGRRLLLSCYTGLLEVPVTELLSFLTAASTLQMMEVVDRCSQAVSKYLSPTLAFLTLNKHSEKEKNIRQPESGRKNQEERAAGRPGSSKQEAGPEECGRTKIQAQSTVSPGPEVNREELKEVRDKERGGLDKKELCEGPPCCLDKDEEITSDQINQPSYHDHQVPGGQRCRQHPAEDHLTSKSQETSPQPEESPRKQSEERDGGSEDPTDNDLTEDPDPVRSVQRPYLCRRCDRVFQHVESYLGHLKEHRQFLCLVCGRGFSLRRNLTRHIGVHTGDKPYRCPLCHATFSQKATLQDHLSLHTGDRSHHQAGHPAHKPGLRRHLKAIHGKCRL